MAPTNPSGDSRTPGRSHRDAAAAASGIPTMPREPGIAVIRPAPSVTATKTRADAATRIPSQPTRIFRPGQSPGRSAAVVPITTAARSVSGAVPHTPSTQRANASPAAHAGTFRIMAWNETAAA